MRSDGLFRKERGNCSHPGCLVLQQIPDNLREEGFLSFTALEGSVHCHREARVTQSDSHHGGQETERKVVCVVAPSVSKLREWCCPHSGWVLADLLWKGSHRHT